MYRAHKPREPVVRVVTLFAHGCPARACGVGEVGIDNVHVRDHEDDSRGRFAPSLATLPKWWLGGRPHG